MALLEKAAGQGHAYAMHMLGSTYLQYFRSGLESAGYEQAVKWLAMGAEAGLPKAMYNLGNLLDRVGWCRLTTDGAG
jgi:TPR repeat protein